MVKVNGVATGGYSGLAHQKARQKDDMRLSAFIKQNMEEILVEWESFASTLPAAASMTPLLLRDHAQQILEAVVRDISTPQTDSAQTEKSKGAGGKPFGAPETAAETHGLLRAMSGFEIRQMASEYRALRASVLKLWMAECKPIDPHVDDIIRFNEAIDQALAESIHFFTEKVEETRNLFLGTLSHDMRTPLQVIQLTAIVLQRINMGDAVSKAARRLIDSGSRMKVLLDNLIQFNKAQLGVGIQINASQQDLSVLFADEMDQLRAAYPERQLDLVVEGQTMGMWDGVNLQRLLGNLVVNAIKYGRESSPVVVKLVGDAGEVNFEVTNEGAAIDTATLQTLFDPLKQGANSHNRADGGLGLGLYIASQIAKAHKGTVGARSENGVTTFFVRLPVMTA